MAKHAGTAILLLAFACILGSNEGKLTINDVTLEPDSLSLELGGTLTITWSTLGEVLFDLAALPDVYKMQDGDAVRIAHGKEFTSDKYEVTRNITELTVVFTFKMKNIERSDAGTYHVNLVNLVDESVYITSDPISFMVEPDVDSSTVLLTSSAKVSEEKVHNYDDAAETTCTATSVSRSENLKLLIMVGEDDVTMNFEPKTDQTWKGEENGFKEPMTKLELTSKTFLPPVGESKIKCILKFNEVELEDVELDTSREEYVEPVKPSINCTSNNLKPVKENDENVLITCRVYDYPGHINTTKAKWDFTRDAKHVALNTGENKYERVAEFVGNTHVLKIRYVTVEMVLGKGKYSPYNVTLYDSDNTLIAQTTYFLAVDSAVKVYGGGRGGASCITINFFVFAVTSYAYKLLL